LPDASGFEDYKMGFSHYWRPTSGINSADWAPIIDDTTRLIDAFNTPAIKVALKGGDGREIAPEVNARVIHFNGVGRTGYEDFYFEREGKSFNFCKTGRQPYDTLVCAVLAVIAGHTDVCTITSNGGRADWAPAVAWASQVLGREVLIPVTVVNHPED
jgi:hypothetical protein